MSSTSVIDFSLRQNKAIERKIVFDGVAQVLSELRLRAPVYAGLGSIWFTDFVMAHRLLGSQTLHSFECDPVVAARARFNRPFRTLRVHEGYSSDLLPDLLRSRSLQNKPWFVWLDYDQALNADMLVEMKSLVRDLPDDSFFVITANALPHRYKGLSDRADYLSELFDENLDFPSNRPLKDENTFMPILANLVDEMLQSRAVTAGRSGSYIPSFKLCYRDGAPMITVGGFLASAGTEAQARTVVGGEHWRGISSEAITTVPMTMKEVAALQTKLPNSRPISRTQVRRLGFDLEEADIALFQKHYLEYPSFVQISS